MIRKSLASIAPVAACLLSLSSRPAGAEPGDKPVPSTPAQGQAGRGETSLGQPAGHPTPQPAKPATPAKDFSNSTVVTRMMAFDANHDGKLTRDEVTDWRLQRMFDNADVKKAGVVTKDDLAALAAKLDAESGSEGNRRGPGGRGGPGGGPGGPRGFGGPREGRFGRPDDRGGAPRQPAVIDPGKLPPVSQATGVTFVKDVQPLFEAACVRCHGEQRSRGGLRLDSLSATLTGGDNGKVVVPGASTTSPLVLAISQLDDETAMPPKRGAGRGGPGHGGPDRGGFDRGGPGGGGLGGGPDRGGFDRDSGPPGAPPKGDTGAPGPDRRFDGGGPASETPAKPLTAEQVGLVRAWIDQGAK